MRRPLILVALLLLGCQPPMSLPHAKAPEGVLSVLPRLSGRVEFPESFAVAAGSGEVVNRATVSVLDAAGQTVAVTLTDGSGAFTLDVNGSFTPTTGAFYTVEAVKGIRAGNGATRAVRMTTLLHWSGSAWNSVTGAASIGITPTTTAVALIKAKQSTVTFPETMGIVTGNTVTSPNPTLTAGWQTVRDLIADLLAKDADPLSRVALNGSTWAVSSDGATWLQPPLAAGTFSDTWPLLDGSVQLKGSMPVPRTGDEVKFAVTGLGVAGVLANDGTYLYAAPWGGTTWTKIGTGYAGTTQGNNHGAFANPTGAVQSGACYGGYLMLLPSGAGNNVVRQRLNLSTGAVDSVALTYPALHRNTGLSETGSNEYYLITDGDYFYNPSYSVNNKGFNGFTVQVYDPLKSYAMVRKFTLDGANTPATGSFYADSFISDRVYMYAMEWNPTPGVARIRRYRLSDGQLEAEAQFGQDNPHDDPITGTYDWTNNKFWFGDYATNSIRRSAGRVFPATGTWTSTPIDAGASAPLYGKLNFNTVAVNGQSIKFQVRSAVSKDALSTATWNGPTGAGDFYTTSGTGLNAVHHRHRWLQVRATLAPDTTAMLTNTPATPAANTTPRLYGVSVEVLP